MAYPYPYTPYQPGGYYAPAPPIPDQLGQLRQGQYQQTIPQTGQLPQNAPQGLSQSSRPVTNRDEANAVPADFSGSLMVFPDMNHNRVYLKRWNIQTGAAEFGEFAPVPTAQIEESPAPENVAFAKAEEVSNLRKTVERIQAEVDKLKKPATNSGKAGKKNDSDE